MQQSVHMCAKHEMRFAAQQPAYMGKGFSESAYTEKAATSAAVALTTSARFCSWVKG